MSLGFNLVVGKIRTNSSSGGAAGNAIRSQLRELKDSLKSISDQVMGYSPYAAQAALAPTLDLAKVYCPKKTGALVNSGYLEITSQSKASPRVEIGFAKGSSPPYAVIVHEMTDYHHASPTRSKWLQAAVLEDLPMIWQRVVGNYREFMGF